MCLNILRICLFLSAIVFSVSESGFDLIATTDFDHLILKSIPCIQEICNKYFNTGQPIGGSMVLVSLNGDDPILQQKLLTILNRENSYAWTVMIKDQSPEHNYESVEKAKNYFTIIDKSEDILEIIGKWKTLSTWNPMAQVVILMANAMDLIELESNRRNLIILLLQNHVLNAYIVSLQSNSSRIEVATLFPYDGENCADQVLDISIVDVCEYDPEIDLNVELENIAQWEVFNHYENKLPNDLHSCPLMVSARMWEPYAFYDSKENDFSAGIDVNIVRTITERLNMFLYIAPQNGTIYEVHEEIVKGVFDFMIGGIDEDPALADYLSTTIPYYQDDLTWCVARAGTSLAWMKIWEMFDGTTWLCVFIFLLIATSFIFGFQLSIVRRHKFIESILSAISIVLNQPLLITNYTLPFRFVMIGFIVFGMILNIMYQSLLITTLTRPSSEPQISKTEQLMNLKMRVFGGYEVGRNMDKNDSVQQYVRSNLESCPNIEECLISLSQDEKRAVAASREHVRYNPRIQRENIYCFPVLENIYSYLVSMVSVKSFHLLDKFNRNIRLITEAGLISKWKSELDHTMNLKEELKKITNLGPKPLTFAELYGIFIMTIILLFLASLTFLFELLVFNMARRKNASRFWKYFDQKLQQNKQNTGNKRQKPEKVNLPTKYKKKYDKFLKNK